ncbi:MAG: hypothetical protein M1830_006586, partial [Pleopsidium flavum]
KTSLVPGGGLNLSLFKSQHPLSRVLVRIPRRRSKCTHDDLPVGRVASTFFRTAYSWPRQEYGEEEGQEEVTIRRLSSRGETRDHRDIPRRIHLLGTGNIGSFVAHALSGIPSLPPTTLLLHRPSLLDIWEAQGRTIELITDGLSDKRKAFDVELALPKRTIIPRSPEAQAATESINQGDTIHNLILTVKAPNTISALTAVKNRLTPQSTILFLQNGMGIIDEVNRKIFPDVETRPNYMLGIITHGVHSQKPFSVVHAGLGTTALGLLPRYPFVPSNADGERNSEKWAPSSRYLLRTLTRTPVLAAVGFSPTDLMQLQLEKLAINAVINPLTVMLDSKNGDLLSNFAITRVMRLLLSEISFVIRSLPELQGVPNVRMRFSPQRLEMLAVSVMDKTSNNISSMLQDVRAGKQTEVDYINGYVVRRGEEMGIKCVMNYMLLQLVKGKQQMIDRRIDDYVPIVTDTGKRR